jgi:hypothetical protein
MYNSFNLGFHSFNLGFHCVEMYQASFVCSEIRLALRFLGFIVWRCIKHRLFAQRYDLLYASLVSLCGDVSSIVCLLRDTTCFTLPWFHCVEMYQASFVCSEIRLALRFLGFPALRSPRSSRFLVILNRPVFDFSQSGCNCSMALSSDMADFSV